MASKLSNSAIITSNENEGCFIKKGKRENDLTREILGIYDPMDQTETTQSKKLSSTWESASLRTNESSQAMKLTSSDRAQKFDAFLSHSGKQKNFVRQLHRDLTNRGVSCFFDEDHECLPAGEPFPPRIFASAKSCKLAVLLLSKEFLETKWPMLELSTFVKARAENSNLKILPLFFKIPPDALKQITADNQKWTEFEESNEERAQWHRALRVVRGINGLKFTEGDNEVKFRDEIVTKVWHILSTVFPRYHVPSMQGEVRMCQEVTDFFNKVQPNGKGIRIAGLYGMASHGKTTLGKAFCNFKLGDFEGKACHLEFSRGDPFERIKIALQYLTRCPQSHLQIPTCQDQAQVEFYTRMKGQRVLLVLDSITDESIDEVRDYLRADLGENSCILLSARSADVLTKRFSIDLQSCMRVPRLEEEEAIAILLERTTPGESMLAAGDRGFALKCAKRCLFKDTSCDNVQRAPTFHPLALKAFGGYLFSKYGSNLSKWAAEIDGMAERPGDGLDEVFAFLGKAFDDMPSKYRTIFMLLTLYMLPSMSPDKISNWLAISCNEEISSIENTVEDLRKKAFIEEFKPKVRIHDLYIEFAKRKANKMEKWLWWKEEDDRCSTRGLIADHKSGFELARLEHCMYQTIASKNLRNLLVLQLVDVQNMSSIDLGLMDKLRSITLCDCEVLVAVYGMENLLDLAWLQIIRVNSNFQLPDLSTLRGLQHLEIDIAGSKVLRQLGDLTPCFRLREIIVHCPSLSEFPRLESMPHLEKVEFSLCDKVKGPIDCTNCGKLQSIALNFCCQMTAPPLLAGCRKLSKLVLSECVAVTACPDIDVPSALKTLELCISSETSLAPKNLESCCELENVQLWNMGELMELPSFKRLSNLTVLKLVKCGIREPPDLTCCDRLEDVYFFQLKNLVRFPNFSSLRELKKLILYDCIRVRDPPDIGEGHKLKVFHVLYNDNMQGISKMDKLTQLEEIKVSWQCKGEVTYEGIDPESCQVDEDLEYCLDYWKDEKFGTVSGVSMPEELKEWEWLKGKTKLVKRYFRGVKLYYSLAAPCKDGETRDFRQNLIILRLIDSRVMVFPTLARDCQDRDWLNKVGEYFAGKKVIACATASSVSGAQCKKVDVSLRRLPSPRYHVKMRKTGRHELQGKSFSRFDWRNVDHKAFHRTFCGGLARQNVALQRLTQLAKRQFEWATRDDETIVRRKRVLLVLDNITEASMYKRNYYLGTESEKNNCILWMNCQFFNESADEAITICLRRISPEENTLGAEYRVFDLRRPIIRRLFNEKRGFGISFVGKYLSDLVKSSADGTHLIASKVFGRDLFSKCSSNLLKWVTEIKGVDSLFAVLCWLKIPEEIEKALLSDIVVGRRPKMRKERTNLEDKLSSHVALRLRITWGEIKYTGERLSSNTIERRLGKVLEDSVKKKMRELWNTEIRIVKKKMRVSWDIEIRNVQEILRVSWDIVIRNVKNRNAKKILRELWDIDIKNVKKKLRESWNMDMRNVKKKVREPWDMEIRNLKKKYKEFWDIELDNVKKKLKKTWYINKEFRVWWYIKGGVEGRLAKMGKKFMDIKKELFSDKVVEEQAIEWKEEVNKGRNEETKHSKKAGLVKEFADIKVKMSEETTVSSNSVEVISIVLPLSPRYAVSPMKGEAPICQKLVDFCNTVYPNEKGISIVELYGMPDQGKTGLTKAFCKQSKYLSKWAAEIDGAADGSNDVFVVVDKAFDGIKYKCRAIFMLLTIRIPPNIVAFIWLALNCIKGMVHIEKAVADPYESVLIAEIEVKFVYSRP